MRFVISSTALSQRLQSVGRVIASKNSLPILDNFLFNIADNRMTVTASDGEITLRTSLDLVECDGDLDFVLNAKSFQEAIKEIPEQPMEVNIHPESYDVRINYQNGHFDLLAQGAEQYPTFGALKGDISSIVVDAQRLYSGVNRALFAAADDPIRMVMNGIFVDYNAQGLAIVASDGRKLSCSRMLDLTTDTPSSFILHKKPANIVKGILQKEVGDVTVRFTKQNAVFESENYLLSCRLTEGSFPNYNSVIPKDNPNLVTIHRGALISALRRVMIFANLGNPMVRLHIEPGRLVLSARDVEYSRAGEESLLCEYAGMPMNIGFKGTLLMELLNNLEGEEVILQLADPSRAGVIVPAEQPEQEHILMLLMPMMLND